MAQGLVIVINGKGGVGKDTLCAAAAEHFKVCNISSITPIKEIAAHFGWQGEKDDRARKFLADLKAVSVEYNDFPTVWLKERYSEFLASEDEILFVHIREPEEIAKLVKATDGRAKTLLVRADSRLVRGAYGNAADDCVENYYYDYYFDNDDEPEVSAERFVALLRDIMSGNDFEVK